MRLLALLLLFPLLGVQSRILFPEELVSFLSFVYSVIPPFKIGQDSRIGAGFRVGPNADFQILLELGPQSETQPLGPDGSSTRDTRAPLALAPGLTGTNRRKSLKGKKHTFETKQKNSTGTEVKPNNNINESFPDLSKQNSTTATLIEPQKGNLTETNN